MRGSQREFVAGTHAGHPARVLLQAPMWGSPCESELVHKLCSRYELRSGDPCRVTRSLYKNNNNKMEKII